ncbi:unnamed protein product [Staurois parvus]|uniref:Uncharacterized protein n=1 Tax=Staurois parvus TaxID=386267 RepID=A0ABN9DSQ6_9NEOB|nr:unnamed protein product [Staurois parvus]
MRCVHDLTDPGLLFIRCSSALISIPGSNLISFLAAISSASLSCSSGYGGMLSHLDVIRFSAHTAPLIHHSPEHGCSLFFLFSLNSV